MIAEFLSGIGIGGSHVSRNNRLVSSFIYGIDDHSDVSPDNHLIDADLGEAMTLESTEQVSQTEIK